MCRDPMLWRKASALKTSINIITTTATPTLRARRSRTSEKMLRGVDILANAVRVCNRSCNMIGFMESPYQKPEGPGLPPGLRIRERSLAGSVVHSARRHRRGGGLLLRHFGDHRLGGDQEPGDRGGVLQGAAHHLGGIDDALGHEIAVLAGLSVEA